MNLGCDMLQFGAMAALADLITSRAASSLLFLCGDARAAIPANATTAMSWLSFVLTGNW